MKTCKDCKLIELMGIEGKTRYWFCEYHQQEVNEDRTACSDILEKDIGRMKKELTNEDIVRVLERAKAIYLFRLREEELPTLCWCIIESFKLQNIRVLYEEISQYIPMINPIFLKVKKISDDYWWSPFNTEKRIKAFDKLINYYKNAK
jgi:hypothetical protein